MAGLFNLAAQQAMSTLPRPVRMAGGGGLPSIQKRMNIGGQPHRLAYITTKEEDLLKQLGGLGEPVEGTRGVPAYIGVGDAEGLSEDYSMPSEDEQDFDYGEHSGSMTKGKDYGRAEHALDYGIGREGWSTMGSGHVDEPDYARPPGMGPAGKTRGYVDPDLDPFDPEHSAYAWGSTRGTGEGYPTEDDPAWHQYAPNEVQSFLQSGGLGIYGMMAGALMQSLDHYTKTGHLGGHVSQGLSSLYGTPDDPTAAWDTDPHKEPIKRKIKKEEDKKEEEKKDLMAQLFSMMQSQEEEDKDTKYDPWKLQLEQAYGPNWREKIEGSTYV